MIIDILMVNTIFWSLIVGYKKGHKRIIAKLGCILFALMVALSLIKAINLIDNNMVIEAINQSNYTIPVTEKTTKDYFLTKGFVDELPVTTEIQKKIISHYYSDNSIYVAEELIFVSSMVITKTMEFLLFFIIIIFFLNGMGVIINHRQNRIEDYGGSLFTAVLYLLSNLILVSSVIVLSNLLFLFLLTDLPKINLEGSIFIPVIHKIVDMIIRLL